MILVVTNYVADALMCIILRKRISWPCLAWSLPAVFVGHALGIGLVVVVSNVKEYKAPLALVVSCMLLALALYQMRRVAGALALKWRAAGQLDDSGQNAPCLPPPLQEQPATCGVLWSACTPLFAVALVLCRFLQGFFSGSTGMGGWPPMVFVLTLNPAKDEWRATQSAMLTGLALVALPILAILGILAPLEQWPLLLCCVAGQALGTAIGNAIRVDQETWLVMMAFIVFLAALTSGGRAIFSLTAA